MTNSIVFIIQQKVVLYPISNLHDSGESKWYIRRNRSAWKNRKRNDSSDHFHFEVYRVSPIEPVALKVLNVVQLRFDGN